MNIGKLQNLIKNHEGYRQYVYNDQNGSNVHLENAKATIGIGRNLEAKGISLQEAYIMLDNDVNYLIANIGRLIPFYSSLDEVRQAVLIDMGFNLGVQGLLQFHSFLHYLEQKDYNNAATSMLDSKWAKQVGPRATELSDMISSGNWPANV